MLSKQQCLYVNNR